MVLLAPSLNAYRIQLFICKQFLKEYHLYFNSAKTQLIFTCSHFTTLPSGAVHFFGDPLSFCNSVSYLGLVSNLSDSDDISKAIKKLNRKAVFFRCFLSAVL